MNTIEKIKSNKNSIAAELYEWAETFDWELDEEGERTTKSHDYIHSLAKKLESNQCSREDFKVIIYNIYQINYNEIKIRL